MKDLPGIGTRVTMLTPADGPHGQEMTVAGFAMTCDPIRPGSPMRPLLVLSLNPGFYDEKRTTFVTAYLALPENVVPMREEWNVYSKDGPLRIVPGSGGPWPTKEEAEAWAGRALPPGSWEAMRRDTLDRALPNIRGPQ